jgi:hypothetical protein
MKFVLIKGKFYVVGQSPDADSVKFRADDDKLWDQINTENRDIFQRKFTEENGVVTLRFQGIDALETHYAPPSLSSPEDVRDKKSPTLIEPKPEGYRQIAQFGRYSTDELLRLLGVTTPKWRTFGKSTYISEATVNDGKTSRVVKTKLGDALPGYIICGDVELNGRPLAWVFPGTTTAADGTIIPLDQLAAGIEHSANYMLVRGGLVYPLFFMTLPGRLRQKLATATLEAQADARTLGLTPATPAVNLWQIDQSTTSLTLTGLRTLVDEYAIFPYLFRKVIKHQFRVQMERYWDGLRGQTLPPPAPGVDLTGFFRDANPYVFVVSDQDFVRLDDVVEARGNTLRMRKAPHDLVLLS